MGRPKRNEVLGSTYHVFFRGNRGENIFRQAADYLCFLWDLAKLAREHSIAVLAFCLMPNHVHLCLQTHVGGDKLATLMQRLNLRHAIRYNGTYGVRGRLNEARYHAKVVIEHLSEDEKGREYLRTLIHYIHKNPVRARLCLKADQYRYSSHLAYLGQEDLPWLEKDHVLEVMGGVEQYAARIAREQTEEEEKLFRPPRREKRTPEERLAMARQILAKAERSVLYAGRRIVTELRAARERAVKELLGQGFSHHEIAEAMKTGARVPPKRPDPGAGPCHTSEDEPAYGLAA